MWLTFLPESVQIGITVALGLVFAGSYFARRNPHIRWLQGFRLPQLSEQQRARRRRTGNAMAGAEMMLLGLVLPLGFGALTLMTWSDFDRTSWTIVVAVS